MEFYRRHVCRVDPWPDFVMRTMEFLSDSRVYEFMQGPNEFTITGNLRDWDRTDDLASIRVPTLVACGRYDELGEPCATVLRDGVPGAEMVVFEGCSHLWLAEDAEGCLPTLSRFLNAAEHRSATG
jgi:proline iminopeptidase